MSTFDPVAPVTTGLGTLSTSMQSVAGPAIGIGAGILALSFGWRLVKRFAK